jgi:predicted  nucleic acid-binding Zn-ribbon protein
MTTAKKGTNGTKAVNVKVVCPHQDLCQAPSRQVELMTSMDELAKGVGMMLERHEQLSFQLVEVMGHLANVAERQTLADQRVMQLHTDLASLTSQVAQAATAVMRDHLSAVVQYEVDQRLRAAGGRDAV